MNNDFNSTTKNTSESYENISNLFEKTYFSKINLIYYIDYLTYKKELINNIEKDIELIINFFDEEISDIIIKIKILIIKKKISDNDLKIFESLFELINILEKINFFDQEDFLNILLFILEIKILLDKINIFFEYFKFGDLINIKDFINKFNELYNQISKNNLLLKTLHVIISTSNENIAINEIKNLANCLSFDYFMYYDSVHLYDKILNYINKLFKKINTKNFKKKKSDYEFSNFYEFFKNSKNIFINEYNLNSTKHLEIYSIYEFELVIKFKLKNKHNINKLFENLKLIINYN